MVGPPRLPEDDEPTDPPLVESIPFLSSLVPAVAAIPVPFLRSLPVFFKNLLDFLGFS